MGRIDDACHALVSRVEGALACGVVDLETGMLLGRHANTALSPELDELLATASAELFSPPRDPLTLRSRTEAPFTTPLEFNEIQVASQNTYHFAKTMNRGRTAILLVTLKHTNAGLGWAQMKAATSEIETIVP